MGQDKGLMPFLGRPLVQRILERLSPLADEVLVTTNHPQDYQFLDIPLIPDLHPGRGALGGLVTALNAAQQPLVAIVACDMPFASPELLSYQSQILQEGKLDAVIPQLEGGAEPFHAVYRRATCLPPALHALENGRWRANAWYPEVSILFLDQQQILSIDPSELTFLNVNTPGELEAAEKIAKANIQDNR